MMPEVRPACDVCGALDEDVEWCGNCGDCLVHCAQYVDCPAGAERKHDGHTLVLIAEEVTVEFPVTISDRGDVEEVPSTWVAITDWDGSTSHVFCKTCRESVRAGEGGLAEDWQLQ